MKNTKYLQNSSWNRGIFPPGLSVSVSSYATGGVDKPVVFITEGYGGDYALSPGFTHELAERYQANIILVEHRFFGNSVPQPRNWDYLAVEGAMSDLHRIREMMKGIYPGKWIATGTSKGGTTTMMYRTYFPDDADVWVPYVAPVCYGVEDGRHEPFIDRTGSPHQRQTIREYQFSLLRRREEIHPLFVEYCRRNNLSFTIPLEEIYDLCVLEYPFAHWQWGVSIDDIPMPDSPAGELLHLLLETAGPSYFSVRSEPSFFVQAVKEFGYYGYDTAPFDGLLRLETARGYIYRTMLPDDLQKPEFSDRVWQDINSHLAASDPKMICLYGEYDPWTAAAVERRLFEGKKNMALVVQPEGSHRTRISTLDPEMQADVWQRIDGWMNE